MNSWLSPRSGRAGAPAVLIFLPALAVVGVRGLVVDENQHPVAGASVRLSAEDGPATPVGRATTDERGRWLVAEVPAGRWRLTIEAAGFQTATGWTQAAEGATPFVRVVLLRAAEQTVRDWVETGNRLLDAGRVREARVQYERALEALLAADKAPLLLEIARTHFLEGDHAAALALLQEAVLLGPGDEVARTLLLEVGRRSGRRDAMTAWLQRLDREGPPALLAERIPVVELKVLGDRPTGRFRAQLDEPSPWSAPASLRDRVGGDWLAGQTRTPLAQDQIEIYVPSPGADGRYGLFVWISPNPYGHVPDREIREVLDARHVIWAGADRSGNGRAVVDRLGLALDTAHAISRAYAVDPGRVWIGGYSGGGRVASALAVCFPDIFRGGVFYMGANFYRPVPIPQRPGAHWPAAFGRPAREMLDRARRQSRLVFVTSEFDFNRPQTLALLSACRDDGFEQLTYVELPEVGHHYGFRRDGLEKALEALEQRPVAGGGP